MKKELIEKILSSSLKTGADFSEIYYEEENAKCYYFTDGKLDAINNVNHSKGIGIRVIKDDNVFYASSNNLDEEHLLNLVSKLSSNFGKNIHNCLVKLDKLEEKQKIMEIPFEKISIDKLKSLFQTIENIAKTYSSLISRVEIMLSESDKIVTIANSLGRYVKFNSPHVRLFVYVYAEKNGKIEKSYWNIGKQGGLELLKIDSYIENTKLACKNAIEKLDAIEVKGGYYPVILGPGFGGVIFHEACGHGLEATSVADFKSVFTNKIGEKIANDVVTLIDDGTLEDVWGSIPFDDEGTPSKKNVLIENGILKSYLVDYFNSKKMNHNMTGSSRRQNYNYIPTSRMTNTYLKPGNSSFEEMVKSIDYGFYCKTMDGGSVECETGNFNFAVNDAFLIENGQITKRVKGASLIGTSLEILKNIEMVGSDLKFDSGYCGSVSGTIPVTVGEPHIKVSRILVGGKENE